MRAKAASLIAVLSLVMVLAPGAMAGGWATAALVEEPESITAGESFTIRYVVRAHGVVGHELEGMKTSLRFTHRESGKAVEATGTATADPKVYEATTTLPASGGWKWTITVHNFGDATIESAMPTLTVGAPGEPLEVGAARASGMTTIVTISDSGFSPATLEVEAGDMVTWVNEGTSVHQVSSDALGFETSPMIQPGEAFFQTIVESGTIDYFCPPHPSMVGTVIVT